MNFDCIQKWSKKYSLYDFAMLEQLINKTPPMKNFNILIVEDDFSYALELELMLEKLGYTTPQIVQDGKSAIKAIMQKKPDLLLLDIKLEGRINGIALAKQLQNYGIPIIFITAYDNANYFRQAKKMLPAAYLIKPFDYRTLQTNIELALARIESKKEQFDKPEVIFVKSNYQLKKVKLDDVNYLNAEGNYCTIYTDSKRFILKTSLSKLLQTLPEDRFLQVQKSYVIQLSKIDSVDVSTNVVVLNDVVIPIGRKYKKELLNRLETLT